MRFIPAVLCVLTLSIPTWSNAQMRDENILADMPDGYKIVTQKRQGAMTHVEMIPRDQELSDWDDMFTVQIFHNSPQGLSVFEDAMVKGWLAACASSEYQPVRRGTENGYNFSFWFLTCPEGPQTKRPETAMVKAMRGKDALYVAQRAFRSELTAEMVREWTPFMQQIGLCDTRDEKRACPTGF